MLFDLAGQRDGAVVNLDAKHLGRDPERAQDDILQNLATDLLVGAPEGAHEVGPGEDADELAVRVDGTRFTRASIISAAASAIQIIIATSFLPPTR